MAKSPTGLVACVGDYQKPGDLYVRLDAEWRFKGRQTEMKSYREVCSFGPGPDGVLTFWSDTSDGKKSSGRLAEAKDNPPGSVCFEADMNVDLARQVFWSDGGDGMHWMVESRTKKGWSRLAQHHYRPA